MGVNVSKSPNLEAGDSNKLRPASQQQSHGARSNGNRNRAMSVPTRCATPLLHIPQPTPPATCKDEMFDVRSYAKIDEHAIATPSRLLRGSFRQLLTYLTDGIDDDLSKVRVLFRWLTSVDVYNITFDDDITPQSPNDYLRKIKEGTGNYAHLFVGICQMSGICCAIINGMNKSAAYDVGKKVDRSTMGAQWNAVYIQGQWRLVDPFWASACIVGRSSGEWRLMEHEEVNGYEDDDVTSASGEAKHLINEFYFLTDPDRLIWTHFPDDSKWQMVEAPITVKQFEEHFYIRERFHYLGLSATEQSPRKCVLTTKNGQIDIEFALPAQYSHNYKFKYLVYLSRKATPDKKSFFLERFAVKEQRSDLLFISLRFPITGTFKFDLFGLDSADTNIYDLICTYIVHCPQAMLNCLPLPDIPVGGWGITSKMKEAGMTPTSHKTGIITTDDCNVNLRFNMDRECNVEQRLLHAVIDETNLCNYSLNRQEGGETIISVRLPQKGEYALKVYATPSGTKGEIPNVCNYLIKCLKDNADQQAFPNVPSGHLGQTYACGNLRVKPLSHPMQVITLGDGKATISFEKDKQLTLKCEIDHNSHSNYSVEKLEESGENIAYFAVNLPTPGEYALNIFAKDITCKKEMKIAHVFSYLIISKGYKVDDNTELAKKMSMPVELVETSDNQVWIPKPEGHNVLATLRLKNSNLSQKINSITENNDNDTPFVVVNIENYGDYSFGLYSCPEDGVVRNVARYQINRKAQADVYQHDVNTIMEAVKENAVLSDESIDVLYPISPQSTVKEQPEVIQPDNSPVDQPDLPEKVNTTAKIKPSSAKKRESSKKRRNSSANKDKDHLAKEYEQEMKKRQCLNNLRRAVEMRDKTAIETNFKACLEKDIQDELMEKAKRVIIALVGKEKLTAAIVKRDRRPLEDAIINARNENFDNIIDLQISIAQKLRNQLQRLEKLRHDVLSMDQSTVAELRSYVKPPQDMCPVMKATYYLLSNGKILLPGWSDVVLQMSKTGKWSLKRNIGLFDPHIIYTDVASCAKGMIEDISLLQIRDVSAGGATFFIWVSGMIDVVEETGGAGESPAGWRAKEGARGGPRRKNGLSSN